MSSGGPADRRPADPAPDATALSTPADLEYRALVEQSVVSIYLIGNGRVRYANQALADLLGYSRPELADLPNVLDLVHPDDRALVAERNRTHPEGPAPLRYAFRALRKDGATIHCEAFARRIEWRGEPAVIGTLIDVTDQKRAEAAARESQAALQAVIQSASIAIFALDLSGAVTLWNPAAERIFGWSEAEALGRPLPIIPPDLEAESERLMAPVRAGEPLKSAEVRRRRRSGEPVELLVSVAPLRDADGQIRGTVHLTADITEQKEAQDHLRQVQKLESIGQLAGGVAHDLNNLLSVVIGRGQLVLSQVEADHPHARSVRLMVSSAQRGASIVKKLLAFSRRQALEPRVLDLNAVVADIVPMLQRLIGEDIDLAVRPGEALGRIRADRGQIEQVVMNLVVNARDAMPQGGEISLATTNVEVSEAAARRRAGTRGGPYVSLAVRDTGVGMDEATQARVFEPFFTTKEPGKGTGLGLATVYGIVKQSGGNVWVQSELGHGTTFEVLLPRVEAAVHIEPAPSASPVPRGTETILLAEDEAEVREVAREVLETCGYTVLEAPRPADALLIAERHTGPIDLLLTDVIMPQMSGPRLAERLAPLRPEMRVLYMSAHPGETTARRGGLEPGMPYLPKPFPLEALAAKVREVLDAPD
jgi:PAS domain S-box-containing protein